MLRTYLDNGHISLLFGDTAHYFRIFTNTVCVHILHQQVLKENTYLSLKGIGIVEKFEESLKGLSKIYLIEWTDRKV